jgi:hypothetical protein
MGAKVLVAVAIGAVVAATTGYAIHALSSGQSAFGFATWITYRPVDASLWAIVGAAVAAGLAYILK